MANEMIISPCPQLLTNATSRIPLSRMIGDARNRASLRRQMWVPKPASRCPSRLYDEGNKRERAATQEMTESPSRLEARTGIEPVSEVLALAPYGASGSEDRPLPNHSAIAPESEGKPRSLRRWSRFGCRSGFRLLGGQLGGLVLALQLPMTARPLYSCF